MKRILDGIVAVLVAAPAWAGEPPGELAASAEVVAAAPAEDPAFRAYWKDGLRFETADESIRLQLGGWIMVDFAWISEDDEVRAVVGDQEDGVEFRRAQVYAGGQLGERFFFKAGYDFSGGDAALKSTYVGLRGIPVVGHLKAGHFKEPFGLNELTLRRSIAFMERALPCALGPGSMNVGVAVYDALFDDRASWAGGVFKDTDSTGSRLSEGEWSLTGRVTGLPWYEEDGARLLHVGLGASLRSPVDDTVQIRRRPEMHLADFHVDTGAFEADRSLHVAPELAVVFGRFSVQAEYMYARVDSGPLDDPVFSGYYVFGSCFLTGEHRAYRHVKGAFGRVRPIENFLGPEGGLGAVEVAARYSTLDLDDGPVAGGTLRNATAGLNWYLLPNLRIMVNYVFADLKGVGDTHGFMTRFQIDY